MAVEAGIRYVLGVAVPVGVFEGIGIGPIILRAGQIFRLEADPRGASPSSMQCPEGSLYRIELFRV